MKSLIDNEVQLDELELVSAGIAPLAVAGAISGYLWVLDQAWAFGEGLGFGLYDATH